MPVEITTLAALAAADVQAEQAVLVEMLQEADATLDLRRGVLHDLLAYNHAVLATLTNTNLQRYLSARSLLQIEADPTLADADIVDAVLSNWQLTRLPGGSASGEITVVLSAAVNTTIGAGTVFTANGYEFTADAAYTAKPEASLINSVTDRLLTQLPDGNWAFTVNVTAVAAGSAYLITKNTLAIPVTLPLDYVTSYATSDFNGGVDPETNAQLLDRLLQGFAVKTPSNRVTMAGLLTQQPAFAGVLNQSIIGYGDLEMLRDKHSILPMATGGRADWYVRSQLQVLQTTLTKSATLLSVDASGAGTWQIELLRSDVPGFYEVSSVLPPGSTLSGSLTTTTTRQVDLSGPAFVPDIQDLLESAYTMFQTAILKFIDNTVNQSVLSPGAVADYAVTLRGLPLIADMQAFVGDFDQRPYGSDILIKAPIPCFVELGFIIAKKRTQSDPDVVAIAAAVSDAVNRIDFVGRLYAGQLQAVVQSFLTAGMSTGAIDMLGRIHGPDGVDRYIRSSDVLVVPSIPQLMISSRTVQFFTDPTQIAITVRTDVPVPT